MCIFFSLKYFLYTGSIEHFLTFAPSSEEASVFFGESSFCGCCSGTGCGLAGGDESGLVGGDESGFAEGDESGGGGGVFSLLGGGGGGGVGGGSEDLGVELEGEEEAVACGREEGGDGGTLLGAEFRDWELSDSNCFVYNNQSHYSLCTIARIFSSISFFSFCATLLCSMSSCS